MSKEKVLYSDIVLQMATLFITTRRQEENIPFGIVENILIDEDVKGPGLMPGLVFAGSVHIFMLLQVIAEMTKMSLEETLTAYASLYNDNRAVLNEYRNLDPSFVNQIASLFDQE